MGRHIWQSHIVSKVFVIVKDISRRYLDGLVDGLVCRFAPMQIKCGKQIQADFLKS